MMYQGIMGGASRFASVDVKARRKATTIVLETAPRLAMLGEMPSPLTVKELCAATGLRRGAQRRTLRALIRNGEVVELPSPTHWKRNRYALPVLG